MRARTKRPEDIDPDLICCEKLAEMFRHWAGIEVELTEPIFSCTARCVHCGQMARELPYVTVVGNPFGRYGQVSVIAFAFVDLDEGEAGRGGGI